MDSEKEGHTTFTTATGETETMRETTERCLTSPYSVTARQLIVNGVKSQRALCSGYMLWCDTLREGRESEKLTS